MVNEDIVHLANLRVHVKLVGFWRLMQMMLKSFWKLAGSVVADAHDVGWLLEACQWSSQLMLTMLDSGGMPGRIAADAHDADGFLEARQ